MTQGDTNVKRLLIASAAVFALLSIVAAPQIAFAQTKTQNVTVVNPASNPVKTTITDAVVPVEVRNAEPIPVNVTEPPTPVADLATFSMILRTPVADAGTFHQIPRDAVFSSAVLYADVRPATSGDCRVEAFVEDVLVASVDVEQGRSITLPISLPNVLVPANGEFLLKLSNGTGVLCHGALHMQGKFL